MPVNLATFIYLSLHHHIIWQLAQRVYLLCNRVLAVVIVVAVLTPSLEFYNGVNQPRLMYPLPLVLAKTWIDKYGGNFRHDLPSERETEAPLLPTNTIRRKPMA